MEEDKTQEETVLRNIPSNENSSLSLEDIEAQENQVREQKTDEKILRSWKDVARRARIFEYCKVENPNEAPVSPKQDEEEVVGNGDREDGSVAAIIIHENGQETLQNDEFSDSRPRRQSVSNPFHFPQKPIEQFEMLQDEVNLELRSANDQQHFNTRSPSQSIRLQHSDLPEMILEETENELNEEEAKKLHIPLPLFQRLLLHGDNFSGVRFLL